jgi:hypothetical protein
MPDIREPYPVKPVWPTRPERRSGKRKPKEQREKESDKGRKEQDQDENLPGGGSHIDDYA